MKVRSALIGLAITAMALAVIMVALAVHGSSNHDGATAHGVALMLFYWWGGVMACGSPLIYLWLWYRARHPEG